MATKTFVLPGDDLDPDLLLSHPTLPLKLGPGLRHIPPSTITPTVGGQLLSDARKNAIWVEHNNGGRYIPHPGDLVIATVHHSSTDTYHCVITPYAAAATLPQLSFEGATKKTRPQLAPGSLVYARITLANKHMDPELECVSASTGKAEGLGPLTGGMLFDVSLGMARRLMMARQAEMAGLCVLEELAAQGLAFETAVGRNGRVWVNAAGVRETVLVGTAVVETDKGRLGLEEQRKLVRRLVKGL